MNSRDVGNRYRFEALLHDYENDPENGSHYLNEIFDKASEIVNITKQAMDFTRDYILPSLPGIMH